VRCGEWTETRVIGPIARLRVTTDRECERRLEDFTRNAKNSPMACRNFATRRRARRAVEVDDDRNRALSIPDVERRPHIGRATTSVPPSCGAPRGAYARDATRIWCTTDSSETTRGVPRRNGTRRALRAKASPPIARVPLMNVRANDPEVSGPSAARLLHLPITRNILCPATPKDTPRARLGRCGLASSARGRPIVCGRIRKVESHDRTCTAERQ
jgi:hypothetical protein